MIRLMATAEKKEKQEKPEKYHNKQTCPTHEEREETTFGAHHSAETSPVGRKSQISPVKVNISHEHRTYSYQLGNRTLAKFPFLKNIFHSTDPSYRLGNKTLAKFPFIKNISHPVQTHTQVIDWATERWPNFHLSRTSPFQYRTKLTTGQQNAGQISISRIPIHPNPQISQYVKNSKKFPLG